jgi:hypothetical protein
MRREMVWYSGGILIGQLAKRNHVRHCAIAEHQPSNFGCVCSGLGRDSIDRILLQEHRARVSLNGSEGEVLKGVCCGQGKQAAEERSEEAEEGQESREKVRRWPALGRGVASRVLWQTDQIGESEHLLIMTGLLNRWKSAKSQDLLAIDGG